ncbi:MAG: hypothetical protein AB1422_18925, partial [bacterium]
WIFLIFTIGCTHSYKSNSDLNKVYLLEEIGLGTYFYGDSYNQVLNKLTTSNISFGTHTIGSYQYIRNDNTGSRWELEFVDGKLAGVTVVIDTLEIKKLEEKYKTYLGKRDWNIDMAMWLSKCGRDIYLLYATQPQHYRIIVRFYEYYDKSDRFLYGAKPINSWWYKLFFRWWVR